MTAKPAAAPAEEVNVHSFLTTMTETAVPTQTRVTKKVNPLMPICIEMAEAHRAGKKFAKAVTAPDAETLTKIKRWLALAGAATDVSFRSNIDGLNVTFWAVDRITHTVKVD